MDYGGDWVNRDQNFDNIFKALVIVFQMSTTTGWVTVMNGIIDSAGIDNIPIENNKVYWTIYFMA